MTYNILESINGQEDLKKLGDGQIPLLADEIRDYIIETVKNNGGHLSSNLGVVELTLALYKVFDFTHDHLIFDVGHQSYTHKILSGRKDRFDTLRKPGGLSGFTKSSESPYDAFGAGHSSTSLSAALGFAEADKLEKNENYTIAVIGDGAYTGGMIHEALNNCKKDLRLIIILNENEMSISKNIGLFANSLAKMRSSEKYFKVKKCTRKTVRNIPLIGEFLFKGIRFVKKAVKNKLYGSNYFENLGLYYLGPCDGNDYDRLLVLLNEAKEYKGSTVIHIKTQKGRGYEPAEKDPGAYHSIKPKDFKEPETNFTKEFNKHLVDLASQNNSICAVTASMTGGTGLTLFEKTFPDRFFDVGIAEEHALTFSAGLSANGKIPVFCVYSSFLQRGYDNLIHDIALQRRNVVLGVDRCGINSSDGATHSGIFDVSFLSGIPGTEIFVPLSYENIRKSLDLAIKTDKLSAIRYNCVEENEALLERFGDDCIHADFFKTDIKDLEALDGIIVSYGNTVNEAAKAADFMKRFKKNIGVVALELLKPYEYPVKLLNALSKKKKLPLVFIEEGIRYGGAGEIILDLLKEKVSPYADDYTILAIDDNFAELKNDSDRFEQCGISYKNAVKVLAERLLSKESVL